MSSLWRCARMIGPLFVAAALLATGVIASLDDLSSVSHGLFTIGVSIALASAALSMYHIAWMRRVVHLVLFCILLELFYRFAYNGPVSAGLLLSIPETSGRETLELLAGHPILTTSLSVVALLGIFALIVSWKADFRVPARRCVEGGVIGVAMLIAALGVDLLHSGHIRSVKPFVAAQIQATFPFDIVAAFGAAAADWADTHVQASRRAAFQFPHARMVSPASRSGVPEVYVVIVGETSRRSNWSLFGYPRATTPRLDEIRDQLILFDHVSSNATNTVLSLPMALTRAAPATRALARSQKSIIALLKEAGFDTFWISNQERSLEASNPIAEIALDADHVSFTAEMQPAARDGGFDSNLLTRLDDAIAQLPKGGKAVIFLHMEGSHFGYEDRYPASFNHFGAGQAAPRALPPRQKRLLDEYDNTIYFTDFVTRQIIDRLAACACRSGLIYFSDHGERLFDNGLSDSDFGHGFPTVSRQEIEIPFFFWLSGAYQDANPTAALKLTSNAHSAAQLHNLFETIVDLTAVDYDNRSGNLSLFSDQFTPPRQLEVLNMQQGIVSLPVEMSAVSARDGGAASLAQMSGNRRR